MRIYDVDFSAERGEMTYQAMEENNLKVFGQLRLRPDRLELADLTLSLEGLDLTLQGEISRINTSHPKVNLLSDILLSGTPLF